jgi:hypothetical protein
MRRSGSWTVCFQNNHPLIPGTLIAYAPRKDLQYLLPEHFHVFLRRLRCSGLLVDVL